MDVEWIIKLGAIAGAIAGVGKLLLSIYQNTVTKPITRNLQPLAKAIDRLNELLKQSEDDRKELHEINRRQNKLLTEHDWRICDLEKFKEAHEQDHKGGFN